MGKLSYYYSLALTIIICALSINSAIANQKDSLVLLIEQTMDPNKKVDLFNKLSPLYADTAFATAQAYADSAYQVATKYKYVLGKAESLYNKSNNFLKNYQYQKSLEFIEQAYEVLKQVPNVPKTRAKFLLLRGSINDQLSKYYTAIQYYIEASEIYDSLKEERGKATTLLNIGTIHHQVGDIETALYYYQAAKDINEKLGRKGGLVYCYNNIGFLYELKKEYKKALVQYEKGLPLAEEVNNIRMKSFLLENIGVSNMKLGHLDKALTYLEKGHQINLQLKDEIGMAYTGLYLAKTQFLQNQNTNKLSAFKNAYHTGVKFKDLELQRLGASNLSEIYTISGHFEEALNQRLLATRLQDSIANQDIKLKIKSLEIKKEFNNKQREVELEKKEALFEASSAYQTKIRNILLACLALLIFGGCLMYRAYLTTLHVKEQLLVKNSSLKKTEARLAETNKDLQKHIDLNVELEQFAYIASHDIKAPLRTISNFTGILKNNFYEQAAEREKTCFDFVEKSAKSLNLLVDDLLEFSKANSQSVNIETIAFKKLLEEVRQNLDFSITSSNATIHTSNCNFSINADQIKLKQILQNLLSNALKFKDSNRKPIIEIHTREEKDFYYISIKDNGIGISEEHFEEVFDKFARLNSQAKFEGSGLGLSICAKYINKHQGKIWIERNKEFGVTFTFTIKKDLPLGAQALSANESSKMIGNGKPYTTTEIGSINMQ